MITIIWFYAYTIATGVASGQISEQVKFETVMECQSFGNRMTPRTVDFVRGTFKLDAAKPVTVAFQCMRNGTDA